MLPQRFAQFTVFAPNELLHAMLKALLAAALLGALIKLLLWCTAPLRSVETRRWTRTQEAWLKRRPKEQVQPVHIPA